MTKTKTKKRKVIEREGNNNDAADIGRGRRRGNKKKEGKRRTTTTTTTGPRLPSSLLNQFPMLSNRNHGVGVGVGVDVDEDDDINSDVEETQAFDVYEYDEPLPEEDSKKNRRFDPVDNLEYELPDQFEVSYTNPPQLLFLLID